LTYYSKKRGIRLYVCVFVQYFVVKLDYSLIQLVMAILKD